MRWVEGIHYERLESGSLRCLKCQRELKGPSALGPHLSTCWKEEGPPKPIEEAEVEPLPTEEEALENMLREMGVKRAKPIARLMSYSGWDNFEDLSNFLKLSGVGPDRVLLCLEAWARHRGKTLPYSLTQALQTERQSQYYMPSALQNQPSLTREEVLALMEQREKERELEKLKAEIEMLKRGNIENPQKSEVQALREELQKMRQDEVLDRLKRLENYVHGPISNIYGLLGLTVKELSDVIRTSPLRWYLATGQPYPYEQKEVEEEARQSIFSRLPSRYVAEE